MDVLEEVSKDIISTFTDDMTPQVRKFLFMTPIDKTIKHENFFDFCSDPYKKDFQYSIEYKKIINTLFQEGNNIKKLLYDYSLDTKFNQEYISLLFILNNVFYNNSSLFEYTNKNKDNPKIIKSSSLEFEICMKLYLIASQHQLMVKDDSLITSDIRNNAENLWKSYIYLKKAYEIALNSIENYDKIKKTEENSELVYPYNIINNKKFIVNIKSQSISSNDVDEILLTNSNNTLSKWIDDIGGLNKMKARYIIAECQTNENYFKMTKIILKSMIKSNKPIDNRIKDLKQRISFGISILYKSLINKNDGIINSIDDQESILFKISNFMYYYWSFKSHKIIFKEKCNFYNNQSTINLEDDTFINLFDDQKEILTEYYRFNIIKKKYTKLIEIINKNKKFNSFKDEITNKFEKSEKIFNLLNEKISSWKLIIKELNDDISNNIKDINPEYTNNFIKITFDEFIQSGLQKISKLNEFTNLINFCKNIPLKNQIIISNNNTTNYIKKLEDLESKFQESNKSWQNQNISKSQDFIDGRIFGRIEERIEWINYSFNILKNNKHLEDNKSLVILEKSINSFESMFL